MSAAQRYAKALFELAGKQLAPVEAALTALQPALVDEKILTTLTNPRLTPAQRRTLAISIAKTIKAPELLSNTLQLMARNNRLALLPSLLTEFQQLAATAASRTHVSVQSAVALSAEQRAQLQTLVKNFTKSKTVEIEETLQPNLLAGFRAFFAGQLWDESLSGKLARLKSQLTQTIQQ